MFWQHAPEMLCAQLSDEGCQFAGTVTAAGHFLLPQTQATEGTKCSKTHTAGLGLTVSPAPRPGKDIFFCSPKCTDRLLGPSSFLCNGYLVDTPLPYTHSEFKRPLYEVDHAPSPSATSTPSIRHFATVRGHNLRLPWIKKNPPIYTDDGERLRFNDPNLQSPLASLTTLNCAFGSRQVALQKRSGGPLYRGSLLGTDRTAVTSLTHGGPTKSGAFRWG
jgi:hypothetical protein